MNNKTTFWNYINKYEVEIPIIQRDYAQGRKGKEILRESFLSDLKGALDGKIEELKLDFVYGSTEKNKLNPLDGQQRLTTLWLLHWYIALRAKNDFETNCEKLRNFTYETRISSREFCQNLCNPQNFKNFDWEKERVVDYITQQTWFYSAWKQDPTIQSMLRMLGGTKEKNKKGKDIIDGIEELFVCNSNDFQEYWKTLTSPECPIVFYHLSLKDFGLSDDLYIKMNARGKQLTSLENFKADLIGYICDQTKNDFLAENEKTKWQNLLDPRSGFPIKMDTTWTQLFWSKRSKGIIRQETKSKVNHIDEIYFAMLNRFFWNELFMAKTESNDFVLDIGQGDENSTKEKENKFYYYLNDEKNPKDFDIKIAYEGLDAYKYQNKGIPLSFFEGVQSILNNLYTYLETSDLPKCAWDETFHFIPEYEQKDDYNIEILNNASEPILKVTSLTQPHRVVFFAMCIYFKKGVGNITSLTNWMRVVWNLVSGEAADGRPQIRSTQAMRVAMKYIETLDSHDVYTALEKHGLIKKDYLSEFEARFNEEVIKAKQILSNQTRLDGKSWAEIIQNAEKMAFFKGTIRFLYEDDHGSVSWEYFDTKLQNAKKNFVSKECPMIELAKYFDHEQLKTIWSTYNFNYKNWKTILINEKVKDAVHNFLMETNRSNTERLFTDIQNLLHKIKETSVKLLLDWKGCKIVLTNYSIKKNEPYNGYVFEVDNEIRATFNTRISTLENCQIFVPQALGDEKYEINNQVYYRGLWLDFIYKNNHFRYYGDNKIYLMTNKWEKATQTDDECSYYCFNVTKETLKAIEDELNNLIRRH